MKILAMSFFNRFCAFALFALMVNRAILLKGDVDLDLKFTVTALLTTFGWMMADHYWEMRVKIQRKEDEKQ
jgi:hypothetical protein